MFFRGVLVLLNNVSSILHKCMIYLRLNLCIKGQYNSSRRQVEDVHMKFASLCFSNFFWMQKKFAATPIYYYIITNIYSYKR